MDKNGDENFRLYSINAFRGEIKCITPHQGIFVRNLKLSKKYPYPAAFEMNMRNPAQYDAYIYDIKKESINIIKENNGHISRWVFDEALYPSVYMETYDDGSSKVFYRGNEEVGEKFLCQWSKEDGFLNRPLFLKEEKYFYTLENSEEGKISLIKTNINTMEKVMAFGHERYDLSDIVINPSTGEIEAVCWEDYILKYQILDSDIKEAYNFLEEKFKGDFYIVSKSNDNNIWIIKNVSREGMISYYIFNMCDKSIHFLFYQNERFLDFNLAKHEFIKYKSRDGLDIEGYITFPTQSDKEKNTMVVNVHGGPWARDNIEFITKEAQWLASCGYTCLNVNFRGSTGYGKEFLNKGNKEWGKTMYNDLLDGIEWAIKEGYASRDRIAIFGMSYGGYAALAGITLTPEVFKCAVDRVGPSNLISLMESLPQSWKSMQSIYYYRVGDPEKDKEEMKKSSPLFNLHRVKAPVFIAQGLNDPRVKVSESENVVNYLEKEGKTYEYLLFDDEGHVFTKEKNVFEFYRQAEKFLKKYL
jgi:dipeptidyl aminopeptidase/acylaminoacyl peptidase